MAVTTDGPDGGTAPDGSHLKTAAVLKSFYRYCRSRMMELKSNHFSYSKYCMCSAC